jgi:hypothetical protein
MKTIFLAGAMLAAAAASPVFAQPPQDGQAGATGRGGMRLPQSRAEVQQMIEQRFADADANHDGFVTQEEMQGAGGPAGGQGGQGGRRAGMFERADANHDGKLSVEELSGPFLARFDRADANHDGTISPEEREAARAAMRARRQERQSGTDDDGPPSPPQGEEPPQG